RYPDYADRPDDDLVRRFTAKYPDYLSRFATDEQARIAGGIKVKGPKLPLPEAPTARPSAIPSKPPAPTPKAPVPPVVQPPTVQPVDRTHEQPALAHSYAAPSEVRRAMSPERSEREAYQEAADWERWHAKGEPGTIRADHSFFDRVGALPIGPGARPGGIREASERAAAAGKGALRFAETPALEPEAGHGLATWVHEQVAKDPWYGKRSWYDPLQGAEAFTEAAARTATNLSSPLNLALGAGALEAPALVRPYVDLGFAGQMIAQVPGAVREARQAPNPTEKAAQILEAVTTAALATVAGVSGVRGLAAKVRPPGAYEGVPEAEMPEPRTQRAADVTRLAEDLRRQPSSPEMASVPEIPAASSSEGEATRARMASAISAPPVV
ncbi:MAG: hypothetical protein ACREMY_21425, partial [bacterium]